MAERENAYFGTKGCLRLVLWFFLGTILGIIIRIQRGKILGAVLNFFLAFIFIWIDLYTIITKDDITFMA